MFLQQAIFLFPIGVSDLSFSQCLETSFQWRAPFRLFSNLEMFSSMNYHTCMFFLFPQRVPSDLEVGYEKSILTRMTRTETFPITIYFKEPLLFITFSRECVFICYLFPLEHETRS